MFCRIFLAAILMAGGSGFFNEMVVGQSLPNSETETYEVRGTVVNSVSGEPIPGALVRLVSVEKSPVREMRADGEGKFAFGNVPAGVAKVSASKPGYFATEGEPEHLIHVSLVVQKDTPAPIVRLIPEGIIYGRITGADGEPIEGMQVQVLKKKIVDGKGRWVSGEPSTLTDDEGRFRLAELHVGTYFLLAGPENFVEVANGADSSKVSQYGAMFYPGVSDFAEATAIELPAGRHAQGDVKLTRQALYRISGMVEGGPAGRAALVVLNGTGQNVGMYYASPTGAFDVRNVPPSARHLAAISAEGSDALYFGEIELRLSGDLTKQRLKMWHVPEIGVKVRTEVTHEDKTDRQKAVLGTQVDSSQPGIEASHIALVAEEPDMALDELQAERWGKEMVIRGALPGSYRLRVTPEGPHYVASAQLGDVDLLNEDLTVAPGSALPAMEIVLRDDGANLTVLPQTEGVKSEALVVLWPLDAQAVIQSQQSLRRCARAIYKCAARALSRAGAGKW